MNSIFLLLLYTQSSRWKNCNVKIGHAISNNKYNIASIKENM